MRRAVAFIMAAVLLFMLSPCCFAAELLPRPEEGQIVFVDAANDTVYRADFPLSALKSAGRSGDDLLIELPAARLVLRGFFSRLGEWRSLDFSDGKSIGGGDFDENGVYTGKFSSAEELEKSGGTVSGAGTVLTVVFSQYGTEVLLGESAAAYELRQACLELVKTIMPVDRPDWQQVYRLWFDIILESDGSLRPAKARTVFNSGITVSSINPTVVYISDSLSLMPLSEGRAQLRYENTLGEELFSLDVRCDSDSGGVLSLSSICPGCLKSQGGQLHYLACGHYSCQEGYDAAEHSPAQCGIAGHCSAEGDHGKCKNCLEPMCNGQNHGVGLCMHAHTWQPVSLYTSRCVVCYAEYTRPA